MPTHSHKHANPPAIEVQHVSVVLNGQTVLNDVSFDIMSGDLVALLGPNGSGKTTLMRAILGLQPYTQGSIRVLGGYVQEQYGRIGYVPQRFTPDRSVPMTVGEFLHITRDRHTPAHRVKESLQEVGLHPVTIAHQQLANLSGGQLQRVLIARALLHHPEILFLDEPSTGIDIAAEQTLFDLLASLNASHGMTIIMISHEINMVATHVNHVLCLNTSLVCAGPPSVAINPEALEKMYGSDYVASQSHKHL